MSERSYLKNNIVLQTIFKPLPNTINLALR